MTASLTVISCIFVVLLQYYLCFSDSFVTDCYGGTGGQENTALNQGRVHYIESWGIIEGDTDWPYLLEVLTDIYWDSDNRTYDKQQSIGNYTGNGYVNQSGCKTMELADNEYINTYRVLYSDSKQGNGNYVFGLFFRTNMGNEFQCFTQNDSIYNNDTGYIVHDNYYLSGFEYAAAQCVDNICFQFTEINKSQCSWTSTDDKHILNLSSLEGKSLVASDIDNNDLYYVYTPCRNTLKCDNNTLSMAYLINDKTFLCEKYLAVWQNGINEPHYNEELKSWQFVYTNGESCGGFENVFIVQWNCDTLANIPNVIQVLETSQCVYQMIINSTLAC